MDIAVSGSSGLAGRALVSMLEGENHRLIRLVRARVTGPDQIAWDPASGSIDAGSLEGVDAVIHLAGENISSRRWTPEAKKRIRDSRVTGTRTLASAIGSLSRPPRVFIVASAMGYYGDRGDEILTEQSAPGKGFLAEVCQEWEKAAEPARQKGIRVANLRFGLILSRRGGALKKMLPPFQWGMGGRLGSGRQYMSWVSLADVVRVVSFVMQNSTLDGPINTSSPHPVRNCEFTAALGRALHRPTVFPVPAFAARALFGEMADALLLSSARMAPKKLQQAGFHFSHPDIDAALRSSLSEH